MAHACQLPKVVLQNLSARRPARQGRPRPSGAGSFGGRRDAGPRLLCRAGDGDSEASPGSELSLREAYSLLGLPEGASYEAVVAAKNKLRARYAGEEEKATRVELAYDAIFSSQLKARLTGALPVSNKVSATLPCRTAALPPLLRSKFHPALTQNTSTTHPDPDPDEL